MLMADRTPSAIPRESARGTSWSSHSSKTGAEARARGAGSLRERTTSDAAPISVIYNNTLRKEDLLGRNQIIRDLLMRLKAAVMQSVVEGRVINGLHP